MEQVTRPCAIILRRLYNKRKIGGAHTEEDNVFRWVRNSPQADRVAFERDYARCINDDWIIRSKKSNQMHVSLNPRKLKEILAVIQ